MHSKASGDIRGQRSALDLFSKDTLGRWRGWYVSGLTIGVGLGCAGSSPEPTVPPPAPPSAEEAADPTWDPNPVAEAESEEPTPDENVQVASRAEPEFTPGMSVNEAIAAVPSHYDFVGIDADVLAKPLQDAALYEPCKVSSSSRFTVRLAVWDGRVVGADVKAPNPDLERCIDGVVRQLEYKERAKSINTVEFSY